jgi:uncharacterized membrane protein
MATSMTKRLSVLRGGLAAFFTVAGLLHLLRPSIYLPIMPPYLPRPLALIYLSGVCEIVGGVGLLISRLRRAAGYGLIALLVAVFPANVQMLIDGIARGMSPLVVVLLTVRLPLQPVLMALVHIGAMDTPEE